MTRQVARALRPVAGEDRCGDQIGVWEHAGQLTLALADGLGHGEAAHQAARAALTVIGAILGPESSPPGTAVTAGTLDEHWRQSEVRHPSWSNAPSGLGASAAAAETDLIALFDCCDRALADTRGVALALVRILPATGQLLHAAVGNVRALSRGASGVRRLGGARGIVGAGYRGLRAECLPLAPGDWVVLYSDGFDEDVALDVLDAAPAPTPELAAALLARWARADDDAALLLYRQGPPIAGAPSADRTGAEP